MLISIYFAAEVTFIVNLQLKIISFKIINIDILFILDQTTILMLTVGIALFP